VKPTGIIFALVAVIRPGNVELAAAIEIDRLWLNIKRYGNRVKGTLPDDGVAGGGAVVPQPDMVKAAAAAVFPTNRNTIRIVGNFTYLNEVTSWLIS
jgi:hypothetical protein